jgi:hypothetical protein
LLLRVIGNESAKKQAQKILNENKENVFKSGSLKVVSSLSFLKVVLTTPALLILTVLRKPDACQT